MFLLLWCLAWPGIAVALLMPLPFAMVSRVDVLGHFMLFGAMTLAIVAFARTAKQLIILAALTVSYGVALEFAQGYVPHRTFDIVDAAANFMGGLGGCMSGLLLLRFWLEPTGRRNRGEVPAE